MLEARLRYLDMFCAWPSWTTWGILVAILWPCGAFLDALTARALLRPNPGGGSMGRGQGTLSARKPSCSPPLALRM
eukprot:4857623-Pyramimonas_sp.AAC.1